MESFLYSLALIAAGLIVGKLLREAERRGKVPQRISISLWMQRTTRFVMLGLNPIVVVGVFWNMRALEPELALLPALGVFSLAVGGFAAIGFAKLLKLNRAQTGSMFVSGSFTNLGSFGTLFCFVFFGEQSLVYVAMYRLLEEFVYYTVGFPIARLYGTDSRGETIRSGLAKLVRDPFVLALAGSTLAGLWLRSTSWERPELYGAAIDWIVPASTLLLVVSIGYNMRWTAIRAYIKPCMSISAVKFVVVPLCVAGAAMSFGLAGLHDGLALKVVVLLSAMPPAFTSLIPPQLYKLDADLANSSWLLNSGMMVLVLPALYGAVQLL